MSVAIIDYGSGNLRSAARAFARVAADISYAGDIKVTDRAEDISKADRLVLPGVGAFGDCRAGLAALPGVMEALIEAVLDRAKPFLGICVGMQLMAQRSFEHGEHKGLGWIDADVTALNPVDSGLKIPHMGWNELQPAVPASAHPALDGIGAGAHAYFVHSYGFSKMPETDLMATVDYGGPIVAMVGRDNMIGVQFHPEKSQSVGLRLIENFLKWRP